MTGLDLLKGLNKLGLWYHRLDVKYLRSRTSGKYTVIDILESDRHWAITILEDKLVVGCQDVSWKASDATLERLVRSHCSDGDQAKWLAALKLIFKFHKTAAN